MSVLRWSAQHVTPAVSRPRLPGRILRIGSHIGRPQRKDLAALVIALTSGAIRLSTYDPYADGTWHRHLGATVFGLVATVTVWALGRILLQPGSALPAIAALFVLFAGDSVHVARWTHPLTRQGQAVVLDETFARERLNPDEWQVSTTGDGDARVTDGQLVLRNGAESAAYADLSLAPPLRAFPWSRLLPQDTLLPVEHHGWLNRKLTWSATVHLDGRYYTVAEIVQRQLLIQAVSWGLLISYPGERGEMTSRGVDVPEAIQDSPQTWTVEQSPARLAVFLGDRLIWEGPAGAPLDFLRFGDARRDPAHGGSIAISHVRYTSHRPGVG